MEELTKDGAYHITDEMKMQLADFYGNYATEEETAETIRKIYKNCGEYGRTSRRGFAEIGRASCRERV